MTGTLALLATLTAGAAEPPAGVWVWGDLHAHSGWSYDGCEDEGRSCVPRGELPAEDFFASAAENALDFAALTDHAESQSWGPEGADGPLWEVWAQQQAAVQQAEGGSVLPLLGYEWTAFRDDEKRGHPRGTHRTVILGASDACAAMRVPGFLFEDGQHTAPDGLAVFLSSATEPADTVDALWEALDAAEADCGPTRWLSFAHHSAYRNPQETDWSLRENRPDREQLVEMASEHGSSECADPDAAGCDWRRDDDKDYAPEGSVQAALDRGFTLGFVGGTDAHDARPGSLSDGPGAVGHLDDGAPRVQFASGAITGVLLLDEDATGTLDTDTLLDALEARRTLASTGPRPQLRAWAEGEDGVIYLPGELLPRHALPVSLHLEPGDPGEEYALRAVERLGPGGALEDQASLDEGDALEPGSTWTGTWDGRPGDWTYLRLRYDAPAAADGEERIWLSPWFVAPRCGCASGPDRPSRSLGGLLLLTLGLWRRRPGKRRL